MNDQIYRLKLWEEVSEQILTKIRSQQWPSGTKLPSEADLAKMFDVSRATVRSAVKNLQFSGVLRTRSGSGTYVSDTASMVLETKDLALVMADPENLNALVQTRYILEPQMAALAACKATAQEVDQLFTIVHAMEQDSDKHTLMTHGYLFHQAVAQFSHNQVLYGFFQSAARQLRGLRVLDSLTLEIFLDGIQEHHAIAEAIAARNPALAKELMQLHLKKDYAQYLQGIDLLDSRK
jgi:GntR family transcriptional repressor for pyruvate dehydrogenase complex